MAATLEDKEFHYLINCILNAILCFTASTLNGITIYALRKASTLPKPLKTLLFSLAVSDVGVGFLAQPLFTALLGIAWFQGTKNNPNYDKVFSAFIPTLYLFSIASFTGVVILALDRFLAIHLHLRYRELVTQGRLLAVVMLNWVFAAVFASLRLLNLRDISGGIYAFLIILGNIITPILYSKTIRDRCTSCEPNSCYASKPDEAERPGWRYRKAEKIHHGDVLGVSGISSLLFAKFCNVTCYLLCGN